MMTDGPSSISELKNQLRKRIIAERSAMPEHVRVQKSELICQRAIEHIKGRIAHESRKEYVVYAYIPFRAELNVLPIVEWCWKNGVRVAVPRVMSIERQLQFHYISQYEDLQPQQPWGIMEPSADAPSVESTSHSGCILIPGVAFDVNKARLGYGGGFYDKFLHSTLNGEGRFYRLALAYDLQLVFEVPCEAHDLAVDRVITETIII
jgi:5-formyltetrahydrofolate cyclo-ligase